MHPRNVPPPLACLAEDEYVAIAERLPLLLRWLFEVPTRLERLRLCDVWPDWPYGMLPQLSRLQSLRSLSLDGMDINGGMMASIARLSGLRELEIGRQRHGTDWPRVAPLHVLPALTRLALNANVSDSKKDPTRFVAALVQVGGPCRMPCCRQRSARARDGPSPLPALPCFPHS